MTNLTLRTVFALFVAVAVSACSDDSPTSPSASSGTNLSALADGDSGQRQAAHHRPGHGGGPGGEDPPPPVYSVNTTAGSDIIMSGDAGGSGGTVNIRATPQTLSFSTGFIAQFDILLSEPGVGARCFGSQPFDVSGGIMNPQTSVGVAGVQIYFTAQNDELVDVRYQFSGFVDSLTCTDSNLPCTFPPVAGQTATTEWISSSGRMGAESKLKKGKNATTVCDSDDVVVNGSIEVGPPAGP